jgi:hypothetical protein
LLSSVSPALLSACSKEWKENAKGVYKFNEDAPEAVLLCFLSWAYLGDYKASNEVVIPSDTIDESHDDSDKESDSFGGWGNLSKKDKKGKKRISISPFEEKSRYEKEPKYEVGIELNKSEQLKETSQPYSGELPNELLLHLKLYVFADLYMIDQLKLVSMRKLMVSLEALGKLAKDSEKLAVFELLEYAFASRLPDKDDMLSNLALYAGWRLEELKRMPLRLEKVLLETTLAPMLVRNLSKGAVNPFSKSNPNY